ncbi:hypothetical protein DFJ74DRAFT_340323 [Hyaloraphidium curvatum]|nr:hypothetical protein DFJ74DRAFT_340323 [Hyaloraphidium curvatum]
MLPRELVTLVAGLRARPLPRQIGARALSTRTPASDLWDSWAAGSGAISLPNRAFVRVWGADTIKFLQGLITNQAQLLETEGAGQFAAFLTPQGRVLYDAFLYRLPPSAGGAPEVLVECHGAVAEDLRAHLKRYVLRLKAKIADVSQDFRAWHAWQPLSLADSGLGLSENIPCVAIRDLRHSGFGWRVVASSSADPFGDRFRRHDDSVYTLRRVLCGIPEGPGDIVPGSAFPLESNLDRMNGVDFHKGCYVGQELTMRTHSRGVTRKRIMPIQMSLTPLSGDEPPVVDMDWAGVPVPQSTLIRADAPEDYDKEADGAVTSRDRRQAEMGKFCSGLHNVGLALLKLEAAEPGAPMLRTILADGKRVYLRPFAPVV